jgi:hypothetical protein
MANTRRNPNVTLPLMLCSNKNVFINDQSQNSSAARLSCQFLQDGLGKAWRAEIVENLP